MAKIKLSISRPHKQVSKENCKSSHNQELKKKKNLILTLSVRKTIANK